MQHILFVCTGNTCRSPMAMAVLNHFVKTGKLSNLTADSAGLYAGGDPLNPLAETVLKKHGILLENYVSKPLTNDLLLGSDKIIAMTVAHRQLLLSMGVPQEKLSILGEGISDPFGGDQSVYNECFNQIYRSICSTFGVETV